MKWFLRIGLVFLLLVLAGLVAALILIDNIATATVRSGAAFATQTQVECDDVDVSLFGASATIENLDIKNPDGAFREKKDSFMKLGSGSAAVTAGSVMSELIEVPSVTLSNIELSLIGLDDGTKNYEVILEALKRFQGDEPPPETKSEKKIVIRTLTIENIIVSYDFANDPAISAVPAVGIVTIADKTPMVLKDVGSGGVPMSQIAADIITDILIQVTANLGTQLGGHLAGLAGSLVDTLGAEAFGEALSALGLDDGLEAIGELGIDLGEGIIEGGEDAVEGIGELVDETDDADAAVEEAENNIREKAQEEEEDLLDEINPF
ncbi:MAG: hypothetical protein ACPGYV_09140 [Phycisphaeraceae bacterium]